MCGREKEFALSSIGRKWNAVKDAWKRDKVSGVYALVKCRLLYHKDIKRMIAERNDENMHYDSWFRENLPGADECHLQHERVFHHSLSFLVPTYNTRPDLLRDLANSMLDQTCESWEACFYDGASTNEETIRMLKEIAALDERFHILFGKENLGISGNTNKALALAKNDYVALCDHDDLLTPDCVYWILDAAERGADFIYSDEDKTNEDGSIFFDEHLKADFSPEALRSGNYICHIMAMSAELIRSLEGLRSCCDGSQDHDLALRATERAKAIAHIPRPLYHWRMLNTSFSHSSAERCALAAARGVNDQLERLGLHGKAEMLEFRPFVNYDIPEESSVSLIVHSLDGGFDAGWVTRLLKGKIREKGRICEILVIGDTPDIAEIMHMPVLQALDFADAAQKAHGNLLLFLEQGVRFCKKTWLERLIMYSTRPWIGCSGGSIVDRKHNYLVCGYAVNVPACAVARMRGENRFGPTYQLYDRSVRECTAVSSVCMMIRKTLFFQMNGFETYKSDLGAVALGLRLLAHGRSTVVVPEAVCIAPDSSILYSSFPPSDRKQFQHEFPNPTEHYYSVHFERVKGSMRIDTENHRNPVTVITRYEDAGCGGENTR